MFVVGLSLSLNRHRLPCREFIARGTSPKGVRSRILEDYKHRTPTEWDPRVNHLVPHESLKRLLSVSVFSPAKIRRLRKECPSKQTLIV